MAICLLAFPYSALSVFLFGVGMSSASEQINELLHTFFVFWPSWSGRHIHIPMNLRTMLESEMRSRFYQAPALEFFYLEVEDALANSNIESIDKDENEYGWD